MGFGPYSGYNDPPRYGDYEAQRHWMELAVNSPPAEWYRETRLNDPTWWRLDYPPLSGYLAWVLGVLSNLYDPKSVEAYTSRGYETAQHKNFMRWTVLMADLLLLYPILIVLVKTRFSKFNFEYQYSALLMVLACPLLILIDHGHFQYNCVALGTNITVNHSSKPLGSVPMLRRIDFPRQCTFYMRDQLQADVTLLFPGLLRIHTWQAGHLLGAASRRAITGTLICLLPQLNFKRLPHFLGLVMLVGVMVLSTTVLIWLPWLNSIDSIRDVVSAIFPVHRGLYQLKVATFWCISHMVVKWELYFSNEVLVTFSALLTLLSSMPAMACLFINPKLKSFTVGLFIIAQNFFLFGFHVHEKTILLPAIFLMFEIRTFGVDITFIISRSSTTT
jgi:alpha-1,3-glucosyltransferase